MKFSLEFVGENRSWVIENTRERGLQALDRARAALGPHIRDVSFYPMSDQAQVVLSLNEDVARRAPDVFGRFNAAEVCVPKAALSPYVRFSYREENGKAVQLMDVDTERLINDWISAGAPLDWEPPGYKFEEPEPESGDGSGSDSNAEPEAGSDSDSEPESESFSS
jgi:hypothetical protein